MDVRIVPEDEVIGTCAWCGKHIPDDTPVFAFGAKSRPGVDLSEYEGRAIEITIVARRKSVPMMVTSADSEAKREGKDFMFMVCSEECARRQRLRWRKTYPSGPCCRESRNYGTDGLPTSR